MILGSLDAVDCAALRHHGIEQLGVSLNELLPTLARMWNYIWLANLLADSNPQLG
jgi:hypothetical protein